MSAINTKREAINYLMERAETVFSYAHCTLMRAEMEEQNTRLIIEAARELERCGGTWPKRIRRVRQPKDDLLTALEGLDDVAHSGSEAKSNAD